MVFQTFRLFDFIIGHHRTILSYDGNPGLLIHSRFMQPEQLFLQIALVIQSIIHHMRSIDHGLPVILQHVFSDKVIGKTLLTARASMSIATNRSKIARFIFNFPYYHFPGGSQNGIPHCG